MRWKRRRLRCAASNTATMLASQSEAADVERVSEPIMATSGMVGDLSEATAATVAKLCAGISAPMSNITDGTTYASTDRAAAYDVGDSAIVASIGIGNDKPKEVSATHSGDKKATVEAAHCRSGRRHADLSDCDMYEAMAYSSVEARKQVN